MPLRRDWTPTRREPFLADAGDTTPDPYLPGGALNPMAPTPMIPTVPVVDPTSGAVTYAPAGPGGTPAPAAAGMPRWVWIGGALLAYLLLF
jgi:hypothetical protein